MVQSVSSGVQTLNSSQTGSINQTSEMSETSQMNASVQVKDVPEKSQDAFASEHPALSKFKEFQKIGAGAQGTMYRAKSDNENLVAIKVLDIQKIDSLKTIELFEREIDTLKSLHIKGVPEFIEVIKSDHYIYLVEEYINAPSLSSRIKAHERFTFEQISIILTNALNILNALGQFVPPIVHRDIKPDNLLVDDEMNVYLVDFGTVAIQKQTASMSMTMAGTAGYLAPEQIYGNASPAADIFSLGMTILHLMTGVSPCDLIGEDLAPNIEKYIPDNVPKWFVRVLKRMTAPQLSQRLRTAGDVQEFIRLAQLDENIISNHSDNEYPVDEQSTSDNNAHSDARELKNESTIDFEGAKHRKKMVAYHNFEDFFKDFKMRIFWVPIAFILIIFPIFFIVGYLIMDKTMISFITDWMPGVLPFILIFTSSFDEYRAKKPDALRQMHTEHAISARWINDYYKKFITGRIPLSEPGFAKKDISFELEQKYKHPELFSPEEIQPLTAEENERLDQYMRNKDVLYPCVENKPGYHFSRSTFFSSIALLLIWIAFSLWYLPSVSSFASWWMVIYYVMVSLSFLMLINSLYRFFRYQKKRLKDPANTDAYQLYIRRFLEECHNAWRHENR